MDGARSGNELSGDISGGSVQAQSIHGDVRFETGGRPRLPAPAQLPPAGFLADRRAEMAELRRLTGTSPVPGSTLLVVIIGPGGVGKTSLGLRWLHEIREEYVDGQLFVDLRGFSGQRPMPPAEPLERFLRALGVDATSMPADADEQAGLYRTMTAGRRMIVMLDNAVSAAQVRPLLPGPGPGVVVVTTRSRLSGLAVHGARFLEVGPLDDEGAIELLNRMIGLERIQNEEADAFELVALCGGLPLAVCASGARLAARRRWPIARVVRELADETRRLATLGEEEAAASVQAVFNRSYEAISEAGAKRLYRLLGLHPGPDFEAGVAAALVENDQEETSRLLDALAGASLLEEGQDERYHFHDLLRLHARGEALRAESDAERAAALDRLTDWYLRAAVAADLVLMPGRWHLGDYYTGERRHEVDDVAVFQGRTVALEWLDRERPNLLSTVELAHERGRHRLAWQLCEATWPLFVLRKHFQSWIACYRTGLAAARACGDVRAESRMLVALGLAHLDQREFSAAADLYGQALRLEPPGGHPTGAASALEGLGVAELALGNDERAIRLFTEARDAFAGLDQLRGVALMTRHLGTALTAAGRFDDAIEHFMSALAYYTKTDEPYHQARTLAGLAEAQKLSGRLAEAADALSTALTNARTAGARHEEAAVHVALADLAQRRAQPAEADDQLREALAIYTELGAPQAEAIRQRLTGPSSAPPR